MRTFRSLAFHHSLTILLVGGLLALASESAAGAAQAVVAKPQEAIESEIWTLTYVPNQLKASGSSSQDASDEKDAVAGLVTKLNKVFSDPKGPEIVQRVGHNRLLLRGPQPTLIEIKRLLALFDTPWPQIQMNLWAIQVTGTPGEIYEQTRGISEAIGKTRMEMDKVLRLLTNRVRRTFDQPSQLPSELDKAGIDLDPFGPLSLNEALVLLLLDDNRSSQVAEFRLAAAKQVGKSVDAIFPRTEEVFARETFAADRRAFLQFRDALACFKRDKPRQAPPDFGEDYARRLVRTGATVDRLLKSAMDAFSEDMNELFFAPLLDQIQRLAPPRRGHGTSLVGKARVVVTSGLRAELQPELASYVETTRPKPFGKELLDQALPTSKSSDKGALTGVNRVLSGLSTSQALLLTGALLGETEPTYSKVAPGIGLTIEPTVLPDGGAARLTLDAHFGVSTTALDSTRKDVWAQAPPDGIASHHVRTDAVIGTFDLFDLSSFSVETSVPRGPLFVPILGRLPILGPAFQWPRSPKVTHFESMILINTVILPRSLELHRFYGRDFKSEAGDATCDSRLVK